MNPPDSTAELRELCDRLLDGEFSAEDRARIETLVQSDANLRRLYVEIMHQHAAMRQSASRLDERPLAEVLRSLPEEPAPAPANVIRLFPGGRWLRVAAAVLVGFAIWWLAPQPAGQPLATLVETNGARWENSSLPTAPGSPLKAGKLRLESGVARIVFRSGAEVALEGPAELELQGPNSCFLHAGALTAHVPPAARGFVVGTAHAMLIDHGTDFGISADASGRGQVQVIKGEVELRHGQSGETRHLSTHESAAITADRFTEARATEGEPDRYAFLRTPPANQPPTLTLTTAGGNGEAAYVVSPGSKIHFSDTLLLVKNGGKDPNYRRKAYLRFDLTPLRDRKVADATLTLNFEPTGFGYVSLTDECTFVVYGLTDEAQDDWNADTLKWETMPAFAPGAGEVDPAKVVKLGTFVLPRAVASGAYTVSGQAVADFLNADANRRATLIVVRETPQGKDSAVHGFAGNHHPTLAPPTLRLTLAGTK